MQKNTEPNKQLFSGFSAPDTEQINRALAIIAQIPEDPHYFRPKGVEVAAILMDFNVDLKTILAAILSDPRLAHLNPKPNIKEQFGETVATLVNDVNWLNKLTVYSLEMTINRAKRKPSQNAAVHDSGCPRRINKTGLPASTA
jgi:hypothetical protein